MDLDKDSPRLRTKRKQESDEDEPCQKLSTVTATREYRTAERRRRANEPSSEKRKPFLSSSEESDIGSSDSDNDWSSWGSDESDSEGDGDVLGDMATAETDNGSDGKPPEKDAVQETIVGSNHPDEQYISSEYEKLHKKEEVTLGALTNFWASHIATQASKELSCKNNLGGLNTSPEIMELQLKATEKLMGLPYVVSVGVRKDGKQINVTVTDKTKALKLSQELSGPNINLIEARNSHFM